MLEDVIDAYIDRADEEGVTLLLKALAHPSQGGLGYRLEKIDRSIDLDGYDFDRRGKVIALDVRSTFSRYTAEDMAGALKDALEVHVFGLRQSLIFSRVVGTGKILFGLVDTVVGTIGILIPEPSSTVAGAALFVLGVNTVSDGISQLFGANRGLGFNVLGESAAWAGAKVAEAFGGDPVLGARLAYAGILVATVGFGRFATLKILYAPGTRSVYSLGPTSGIHLGRLKLGEGDSLQHAIAGQGALTVFAIRSNNNQDILSFVLQSVAGGFARLVVNGRLVGPAGGITLLHNERRWREIAKGLAKLLVHGAKTGW